MKVKNTLRDKIFEYVKETFGTSPEYLWQKTPDTAVFRHSENKKWYAIIMDIPKRKLGIDSDEFVDIINVKCDPVLIDSLIKNKGYLRAYHMNKTKWISVLLDGTVALDEIISMINLSYKLTL
ncbi:MAG: MmcQ/YjbR family DNA-binding protein [Acutalibacteraceae bacterium]